MTYICRRIKGRFITKNEVTKSPAHRLRCETVNFNNDDLIDVATGGMNTYPSYDHMGRITLSINYGRLSAE